MWDKVFYDQDLIKIKSKNLCYPTLKTIIQIKGYIKKFNSMHNIFHIFICTISIMKKLSF